MIINLHLHCFYFGLLLLSIIKIAVEANINIIPYDILLYNTLKITDCLMLKELAFLWVYLVTRWRWTMHYWESFLVLAGFCLTLSMLLLSQTGKFTWVMLKNLLCLQWSGSSKYLYDLYRTLGIPSRFSLQNQDRLITVTRLIYKTLYTISA